MENIASIHDRHTSLRVVLGLEPRIAVIYPHSSLIDFLTIGVVILESFLLDSHGSVKY